MNTIETIKEPENLKEVFASGYAKMFGKQWPMWVGGLLFGALNVFMFAYEKAWSVSDGVRNWGNWFLNTIEVSEMIIIEPHLFTTSILNFGIILGAMASALLSKPAARPIGFGIFLLNNLVSNISSSATLKKLLGKKFAFRDLIAKS